MNTLELKNLSVQELSTQEKQEVVGGFFGAITIFGIVSHILSFGGRRSNREKIRDFKWYTPWKIFKYWFS